MFLQCVRKKTFIKICIIHVRFFATAFCPRSLNCSVNLLHTIVVTRCPSSADDRRTEWLNERLASPISTMILQLVYQSVIMWHNTTTSVICSDNVHYRRSRATSCTGLFKGRACTDSTEAGSSTELREQR